MYTVYNIPQRRKINLRKAKKHMDLLLQKATTLPGYGTLIFTSLFH